MLRQPPRRRLARHRRGGILILALVCLTAMFAFAALAVDVGYLMNTRTESHRTADAAALGACWEYSKAIADGKTVDQATTAAREKALALAGGNPVATVSPSLAMSGEDADFKVGYLSNLADHSAPLDFNQPNRNNAIEIRVRRTTQMNGGVPVFFARVFGLDTQDVVSSATAAVQRNVSGFTTRTDGGNIDLLPFALDNPTWTDLCNKNLTNAEVQDKWTWNAKSGQISSGPDGICEVNLYPKGNGSPGNRGTVDIGGSNNSTADIARQILHGVSAEDLSYHGGELKFTNGTLTLNGDTGISAGVKDELTAIKGLPRCIPIFSTVVGPGNNADYTITKFVGVRIMEVVLTGSNKNKRVIVQPCTICMPGAIPSDSTTTSDFVFSRVVLVR